MVEKPERDCPLTEEEANRIAIFLDLHAPPVHADLAIVFGTRLTEPVRQAAELFKNGMVDHVALTGGVNPRTGIIEAVAHKRLLLEHGVPEDRIIIEQESTNTSENVIFALREIGNKIDLASIKGIVAVTKWYHSRRAVMTLKRHLGQGTRYYVASYEPERSKRLDWYLHAESARPVLKEWESIPEYLRRGYIAEVRKENGSYI